MGEIALTALFPSDFDRLPSVLKPGILFASEDKGSVILLPRLFKPPPMSFFKIFLLLY